MAGVVFKGLDAFRKKTNKMVKRMKDESKLHKINTLHAMRDIDDHFKKEEGPNNKKWVKWSKKTDKGRKFFSSRPTRRGGTKLLQDTGRLKGSFVSVQIKNGTMILNNVKYASFHQTGTSKMPRRKFLYLSPKARSTIVKRLNRFYFRGQ